MKSIHALLFAASLFAPAALRAEDSPANDKCPMMTKEDIDDEHTVEFKGLKIGTCCGGCEKGMKNEKAAAYYVKVANEMGLLPQVKGKEKELGLDAITLMPQRFCPIRKTCLVTPESPSVDYKGKKVYLFNNKAKAKWEKDPEGSAAAAIKEGLLPQLAPH